MAITQDRMIALVRAADSAMHKLQELRGLVQRAVANPDANEGMNNLASAVASLYYAMSQNEIECIVAERVHYKHAEHRNNRAAARMRRKRGQSAAGDSEFLARSEPEPKATKATLALSDLDEALDGDLELGGGANGPHNA